MRKRVFSLLGAAMLCLWLLVAAAMAAEELYFLSLNDNLSPLTPDLMPIRANNAVYIPSETFNQTLTGINLGVFFGQDKAMGTVTLYSREKTLIFNINGGYATDSEGNISPYRLVVRNGRIYFPAYKTCQYFGLEYSALSTEYGPLIRIKRRGSYSLTDTQFISQAANRMNARLNEYLQSQASASPTATPSSPVTPSPSPTQGTGDKSGVRVYLAIRVEEGQNLAQLLDVLDNQSVPALFFLRPQQLEEYDMLLRRMVGSGHQVGLLVAGDSGRELEEQIAQGNLLLEQMLLRRSYMVLADSGDNQRSYLREAGYLCWQENVDGRAYGRATGTVVSDILEQVEERRYFARITLEDTLSPTAYSSLLRQLKLERYDIRPVLETTF